MAPFCSVNRLVRSRRGRTTPLHMTAGCMRKTGHGKELTNWPAGYASILTASCSLSGSLSFSLCHAHKVVQNLIQDHRGGTLRRRSKLTRVLTPDQGNTVDPQLSIQFLSHTMTSILCCSRPGQGDEDTPLELELSKCSRMYA